MLLDKEYWNNKWPKNPVIYAGRALRGQSKRIGVDVRLFITPEDLIIKNVLERYNLRADNFDETVWQVQKFVVRFLRYKLDEESNKCEEFWEFPFETLQSGVGDCIANYEEIYTEDGVKRVDELKVGDNVLSYDFDKQEFVYKPVTTIWEKGLKKVSRIHFRNGTYLDLSDDHKLLIYNDDLNQYNEVKVKSISPDARVPLAIKKSDWHLNVSYISYIEKLGETQMRDFEVADTHNFVTRQGIIISNCESGGILIATLCIAAGIPNWRIKVAAGNVKPAPTAPLGGHAWCIYLADDGEWRNIDWCFYEDSHIPVPQKPLAKNGGQFNSYKEIWFTFNNEYSWAGGPITILAPRVRLANAENIYKFEQNILEETMLFINSRMENQNVL